MFKEIKGIQNRQIFKNSRFEMPKETKLAKIINK